MQAVWKRSSSAGALVELPAGTHLESGLSESESGTQTSSSSSAKDRNAGSAPRFAAHARTHDYVHNDGIVLRAGKIGESAPRPVARLLVQARNSPRAR